MNSKQQSFKKFCDKENNFSKNLSHPISKDHEIVSEKNTIDLRFLKNRSKNSQKLNTEKNSKKSLFMTSFLDNKKIKSVLSEKITKKEIFSNHSGNKYYTANIKNLNKIPIPSIENYKSNVKQAFTGKIIIICRE